MTGGALRMTTSKAFRMTLAFGMTLALRKNEAD